MAPSRRNINGRSPLVNPQRQITSFFTESPSPILSNSITNPNPNGSPATPSQPQKPLLLIGASPPPSSDVVGGIEKLESSKKSKSAGEVQVSNKGGFKLSVLEHNNITNLENKNISNGTDIVATDDTSERFSAREAQKLPFLRDLHLLGIPMDMQPKIEAGSVPPPGFSSTYKANLDDSSVSELVSMLRTAFRFDEFDSVEKVLVARDASLKAEIASLQVKVELERLNKIQAEEELKKKEEQCQKGERALELYEKLLKRVKESEIVNMKTIEELNDKNSELEEEVKSDKFVIDELRAVKTTLLDENRRLKALVESKERKYLELNEKVVKIEDDVKLMKSANGEPQEIEELNEMNGDGCNNGSIPFQRNQGTCKVNEDIPGASGLEPNTRIFEIADSDDEENDDQGHRRQHKNFSAMQTIERLATKISVSDISSSSSSDSPGHSYNKRKRG